MRIRTLPTALAGAIATGVLLLSGGAVLAQIEGGSRGAAPVDSGSAYEVSGVTVDVAGKTADAARYAGWRLAQRKAWVQLSNRLGGGGGLVSDGTLDSLVSGIVVENEQIGPQRYIAKLGVLFDRGRAGSILGISTYADRSQPISSSRFNIRAASARRSNRARSGSRLGRAFAPVTAASITCALPAPVRTRSSSTSVRHSAQAAAGGGQSSTNMARATC